MKFFNDYVTVLKVFVHDNLFAFAAGGASQGENKVL